MNVLVYQLTAPLARGPHADLPAWLENVKRCPFSGTVERAIWAGFHADRLGHAFAAGYGAALVRLFDHAAHALRLSGGKPFPDPPLRGVVALCATEAGGAHPKAIATRLEKQGGTLVLYGEKTFATLAPVADELLVVATRGTLPDGNNRLRMVRVSPKARGVKMLTRPEMAFAPEIPHAVVRFDGVVVEDRDALPGDGYSDWLKPFRTIEDIHVFAATVGYVAAAARAHGFPRDVLAETTSLALAAIDAGARDPMAPLTHVLVAGLTSSLRRLAPELVAPWIAADAAEGARWERDLPLLRVAEMVRAKRTEAALTKLAAG